MGFLIGGRAPLVINDGPYTGVQAEVDTIEAMPVYALIVTQAASVVRATETADVLVALNALYESFESLGRPVWNLIDPRGPIPATGARMLWVPVPLMLRLVDMWTDTFTPPVPSAAPPEEEPDAG